jgi:hypothetical protein
MPGMFDKVAQAAHDYDDQMIERLIAAREQRRLDAARKAQEAALAQESAREPWIQLWALLHGERPTRPPGGMFSALPVQRRLQK